MRWHVLYIHLSYSYILIFFRNEIFWIGLRKAGNAKWGWFDNSTLEWSNFKYKPNKLDFIKACGVVSLYSGWWYTAVCNEKKRFVCQFPYGMLCKCIGFNLSIISVKKTQK